MPSALYYYYLDKLFTTIYFSNEKYVTRFQISFSNFKFPPVRKNLNYFEQFAANRIEACGADPSKLLTVVRSLLRIVFSA